MTTNTILRMGAIGDAVGVLQQSLIERGAWPTYSGDEALLSEFGEVTDGAVRTFQAKAGLKIDGVVGPDTWNALDGLALADVDTLPAPAAMPDIDSFSAAVLKTAYAEYTNGVEEVPLGSNRGPRVDEYLVGVDHSGTWLLNYRADARYPGGFQGAPWCGRFAKFCIDATAAMRGFVSPLAGWGDLASAYKWKVKAATAGLWSAVPVPGAAGIILVATGALGEAHGHVVLISNVDGARVGTIEGNSGNRVARRWRPLSQFAGFVTLRKV